MWSFAGTFTGDAHIGCSRCFVAASSPPSLTFFSHSVILISSLVRFGRLKQDYAGCQLSGFIMVNRVPGNFHIEARSAVHSIDPTAANVRYLRILSTVQGLFMSVCLPLVPLLRGCLFLASDEAAAAAGSGVSSFFEV